MREILSAIGWQAKVLGYLVKAQPWAALVSVFLGMAGHVAHVLAFLLPLKVILLAGAEGVPRYLQPIVNSDQKSAAIFLLASGAIACYVLTLFFDAIVKRQSLKGSAQILEKSNSIAIINNQEDEASSVFLQFMQICANLLFVLLVLGLLSWMSPVLAVCLVGVILAAAVYLTKAAADRPEGELPSRRNIGTRLKILASTGFFLCFTVILLPFVLERDDSNVLVAIVSFILIRQVLNVLPKVVRRSMALAYDRPLVNALIFRDHQFQQAENGPTRSFRALFEKPARVERVRAELGDRIGPEAELDVIWVDSANRDFQTFEVRVRGKGASSPVLYLERIVPPNRRFLAENELFLFENMSPQTLKAPPLVARFTEGRFECLVSEVGEGETLRDQDDGTLDDLLEHFWTIEPSKALIRAYSASHPLLHARLSGELVSRILVAIDDPEERSLFDAFSRALPRLQRTLRGIPLYIFNPDLEAGHVYGRADGACLLANWGRWSLEPIGATLPKQAGRTHLAHRLDRVRSVRPSMPADVQKHHLLLVHEAIRLERLIERSQLKQALERMSRILSNPVLDGTGNRAGNAAAAEAKESLLEDGPL